MKNFKTELVFILDRSGSMSGLETDTIGGFNSMIKKQREQEGECYVSTFLFDNTMKTVHDRVPLERVNLMTERDYYVGGSTALLDALGNAINHIGKIHKYSRREDVPDKTIFVITTDGMENSSYKYNSDEVKRLIEKQKAKYDWEFIFLAANIDAVETARTFGIDDSRAVNYHADAKGTACLYETVSEAVCNMRVGAPLANNWRDKIDKDYNSRKK